VPVEQAVDAIAAWVAGRANVDPTAEALVAG
jgi:threonyl-tRNA synthetase